MTSWVYSASMREYIEHIPETVAGCMGWSKQRSRFVFEEVAASMLDRGIPESTVRSLLASVYEAVAEEYGGM